jgi:hypothetical protein
VIYFAWDEKNVAHIAEHGVTPPEAEHVVAHPATGYPVPHDDDKILTRGQTAQGRYIQVIYVELDEAADVDYSTVDLVALEMAADAYYVIHSRPLTDAERQAIRGNRKRKGQRNP